MDDKDALRASYDRFGLSLDASRHEVERAYRKLRDLYSEESLATYSLMGDDDRQERLVSLQASYDLILQSRQAAVTSEATAVIPERRKQPPVPESRIVVVDADPQQMPGLFLQQMREARGFSLQDIAERTKISSLYLRNIEEQQFSALPAPVYLRGFLKEFCRSVQVVDSGGLVESYMALCSKVEK